ncbi:hypothetical protein RF11_12459 [Thelohanellus kitauei]|uniref:Uncharacterized protein n=1 Tax=Thelohanellus kitauei TaxID=669202 RepID=A0A0C2N9N5_THEKT|nr:hypothetical protein RF11_12459 [Thelohanellus kitauei]
MDGFEVRSIKSQTILNRATTREEQVSTKRKFSTKNKNPIELRNLETSTEVDYLRSQEEPLNPLERIHSLVLKRLSQPWRVLVERGGQKRLATKGGGDVCISCYVIPPDGD